MEMERINEDTIKVLIMPEDLEERGINFLELISNHARIEQFFYSILEEVDVENQFAESDSVTFHVIPSDRGLELYISRSSGNGLEDLLENEVLKRLLDRRKSALKDKQQAQDQEDLSVNEKLEVLEGLTKEIEAEIEQAQDREESVGPEIVCFDSLDDFLKLARQLRDFPVENSLYRYNDAYYLVLSDVIGDYEPDGLYQQFLFMLEFGEEATVKEAILKEHGELLQAGDALAFFAQF